MSSPLPRDAARVLQGWRAPDSGQEALRVAYLAHLAAHPDGTWRSCTTGHVTTSALVLDSTRSRTLLTLHPKVNRWLQLGGHCEPTDLTLASAAAREAREESGIDGLRPWQPDAPLRLDRHLVPCWGPGTSVAHLDVQYVFVAAPGAEARISEESLDLRWWPVDALPGDADDALRALVAAATAQSVLPGPVVPSGSASPSSASAGSAPTASGSMPVANATPSR